MPRYLFFNTCAFRPHRSIALLSKFNHGRCTPYIHLPGVSLLRRSTPGYQHISPPGKDSCQFNTVVKNRKLSESNLIFTYSLPPDPPFTTSTGSVQRSSGSHILESHSPTHPLPKSPLPFSCLPAPCSMLYALCSFLRSPFSVFCVHLFT